MTSSEPPILTEEGRMRLEERARRLEEETIPAVQAAIDETEDDLSLQLEHDLATGELDRLRYVLETARSVGEIPEDPDLVQIGDWVSLRTQDGEMIRHLIVDPAEAGVDELPLGPGRVLDPDHHGGQDALEDAGRAEEVGGRDLRQVREHRRRAREEGRRVDDHRGAERLVHRDRGRDPPSAVAGDQTPNQPTSSSRDPGTDLGSDTALSSGTRTSSPDLMATPEPSFAPHDATIAPA